MIGRRLIVASSAALLLHAASAAAATTLVPPNDPRGLIRSIYDGSFKFHDRNRAPWLDARDRPAGLSKALVALWRKADARAKARGDEVGPIEADVTTNSQGVEVGSFALKVENRNQNRATVAVTLVAKGEWVRASPAENVVRHEVVRKGGRWTIDDIRSRLGNRDWSLKDLLTRALNTP